MMTRGKYILDADGNPVPCNDLITWAEWFETADRVLRSTSIGDTDVVTVFIAIDMDFTGMAPRPVLWETLVIDGPCHGMGERYDSRDAALEGHQRMVHRVTAAQGNRG